MTDLLDKLWQGMQAGAITAALPETRVDDGQTLQLALPAKNKKKKREKQLNYCN